MKVLYLVFRTHNTVIIFTVMKVIYLLRKNIPYCFTGCGRADRQEIQE